MEVNGVKTHYYCLLMAARDSDYVKKAYGGYFDVFLETFAEEEKEEQWDMFRVVDGEFPDMDELHKYHGFVNSGSSFDAFGDDLWILKLCFLLQTLNCMEKKVLGICFGHQILCRALGGKIGRTSGGWDIGLREVSIVKNFPISSFFHGFKEIPPTLNIIECHQDEVWEVPVGADVIASSDHTKVEMFTLGEHILGIQGHPEYTKDILYYLIDCLTNHNYIEKGFAGIAKSRLEMAEPDRKSWEKICRSFLKGR